MESRYQQAWRVIRETAAAQSEFMSKADKLKAIDAAYPFGERAYHPYKAWLKARQEWMQLNGLTKRPNTARILSPLERAKARSEALAKQEPR